MGGSGSTRWRNEATRPVAEHSLAWSIKDLRQPIAALLEARRCATPYTSVRVELCQGMRWRCGGRVVAEVSYTLHYTVQGHMRLELRYALSGKPVTDHISLEAMPCNYGGRRWYFRCPCGRRCGVLFNASGRWRCRHCGKVTYTSSNESRAYTALWRSMGYSAEQGREAHRLLNRRYR